jgi:endonuclease/exonuclease/phosphatase family metal-dependent hydrolase
LIGLAFVGLAGCQAGSVKPQTSLTLRVLSYNIHHGEAMDKKFDYPRLAKVINDLSPDLVALQEVDVGTERAASR